MRKPFCRLWWDPNKVPRTSGVKDGPSKPAKKQVQWSTHPAKLYLGPGAAYSYETYITGVQAQDASHVVLSSEQPNKLMLQRANLASKLYNPDGTVRESAAKVGEELRAT